MITEDAEIAMIFDLLHDGDIQLEKEEDVNHLWKVDCEYLAELVQPTFKRFWIRIIGIENLNLSLSEQVSINNFTEKGLELGVLSAELEEEQVAVWCEFPYEEELGVGKLLFSCQAIEVYDEAWNIITYDDFRNLARQYWSKYS